MREYKSLDKYFSEISKIDLISIQEEITLVRQIKEGDQAALDQLTKTNLRFVVSVAKQYQYQGLTLGDLINEGNIGLINAAKRYDETKGFKFISYAVWWIRQSIIHAIAEHARIARLPYNKLGLLNKIHQAISKLEQLYGRKPHTKEVAGYLEIPIEKVSDLINGSGKNISMDEPYKQDEEHTLLDVLQSVKADTDERVVADSISKEVECSLRILSEREREILILYFGLKSVSPLSLGEIGIRFNISKEHVGRLKEKALCKLRHCSHARVLRSCLS
jgi:RNA polymerase primary sigma factor